MAPGSAWFFSRSVRVVLCHVVCGMCVCSYLNAFNTYLEHISEPMSKLKITNNI